MNRTRLAAGLVVGASFALPAAASAQSTILKDDAEGAIETLWAVTAPPEGIEPWQKSDSAATKFRGNQAHGGSTSYWSGMQPQNFPLVPTTAGPGTTVEGESIFTLKEPIIVPADGDTILSYWSLFQNEGDDAGISQVAPISADGKLGAWKNLKSEAVVNAAAGDTDPRACDPSRPDSAYGFEEQKGSLKAWAGFKVLVRFNLKYGAENRPVSHPCGWYLDDIAVNTTGTPGKLGGASAPAGPATGATPPSAVAPKVRFTSLKARGKKARLSVTVSGSAISGAKLTLAKGRKRVATGKASFLKVGKNTVTFKLKRKLAKGTYTIKLTGKAGDGSAVTSTGKVKGR